MRVDVRYNFPTTPVRRRELMRGLVHTVEERCSLQSLMFCLSRRSCVDEFLPVAGKVNAHVNQRVNPTDVIAEATFVCEHVLLDVARTFWCFCNVAHKLIKVKEGDRLIANALVAEMSGLIPRSIKAPRPVLCYGCRQWTGIDGGR